MQAGHEVALRAFESHHRVAVDDRTAMAVQRHSRRTHVGLGRCVVGEVAWLISRGLLLGRGLVVQRIGKRFVLVSTGEAIITPAHAVVGDQHLDHRHE